MISAGFEPAPPKRVGLKSTALDHSARRSCFATFVRSQDQIKVWLLNYCCANVVWFFSSTGWFVVAWYSCGIGILSTLAAKTSRAERGKPFDRAGRCLGVPASNTQFLTRIVQKIIQHTHQTRKITDQTTSCEA